MYQQMLKRNYLSRVVIALPLCRPLLPLQRIHTATINSPNCHSTNSLIFHSIIEFPKLRRHHPCNTHQKIFAASRLDIPYSWQMPQGGIDENEDPRNAAIRELKEETGVTSAELLLSGNEEEINLLGDGTEKPEFGQWSWMAPQQTIDLAVDFKKSVYQEVFTVFSVHLQ